MPARRGGESGRECPWQLHRGGGVSHLPQPGPVPVPLRGVLDGPRPLLEQPIGARGHPRGGRCRCLPCRPSPRGAGGRGHQGHGCLAPYGWHLPYPCGGPPLRPDAPPAALRGDVPEVRGAGELQRPPGGGDDLVQRGPASGAGGGAGHVHRGGAGRGANGEGLQHSHRQDPGSLAVKGDGHAHFASGAHGPTGGERGSSGGEGPPQALDDGDTPTMVNH
mmetsp:Transcript_31528/g.100534  ORF Transcript_31528/g.100534 Transcript_31528/m.100534 type:complete len:220 (-) Transcript_31528:54-713(-)